ncbi:MAG: ATP-dependent helicase HepA [Verrucomicrobia bacterium]|nr:MAG: ATP-dependent helicase HepA [Verrucomicrobiota bacterium]
MEIERMQPGQRIVSDSEPELGLGIVLKIDHSRVEVYFPAASEQRQYALRGAPLRRVQFKEGDRLKLHSGEPFVVEGVEERGGLLVYVSGGKEIPEAHLSDSISFSSPEERLLGGQVDENYAFDLRAETLGKRSEVLSSPVRGFLGGRVDLLSHQMFIAKEVASRQVPRVLLADEVGLGKTIEAGLILHRLHLTGRAARVLIVLPEPLIHQWFVEMWRRFNLLFSIFDADRCTAIEVNQPGTNPFQDSQLVISSLAFLAGDAPRQAQALEAGWDLLIVDEAHHLHWTQQGPGPEYSLVEALAARVPALLLLTATPQQLGPEGHFARLRLLDPARYASLEGFTAEASHYEQVATAVDRLRLGKGLTKKEEVLFGKRSERIRELCKELQAGGEEARASLVAALLDAFGTGRVMFRNTRAALSGFPERKGVLVRIKAAKGKEGFEQKLKWLVGLLKELPEAKILLICKTRTLAERIQRELHCEINVACGLFHEGLTLVQRDRNAAFFAEPEGARLLVCSEIGSEGRNFQFAHHLVLFDLPPNPEVLEQRIGRLDRIGQASLIHIHVPYVAGTEEEVLARWYAEGFGAFEANPHGSGEIAAALQDDLEALCSRFDASKLKDFIKRTAVLRSEVSAKLARGYDRLLELNSCRREEAEGVLEQVRACDSDAGFVSFFMRLLDFFGVGAEDMGGGHECYLFQAGPLLKEAFPSLPQEGLAATFLRSWALHREDVSFMSADHPLVGGAFDLMLGSETGNAAFGAWKGAERESLVLEVILVVECVVPAALHADRFLPATPVRVLVDHDSNDLSQAHPAGSFVLDKADLQKLLDKAVVRKKLIPAMLEKAQEIGRARMQVLVASATEAMEGQLSAEIERLEQLRELNDHVRPEEISLLAEQKAGLAAAFCGARVRVDALRLILRTP